VTNVQHSDDGLPPYVSDDTVAAADEVVRLKAEVESLGLRRQKEEALDWFRERDQIRAEGLAEQQEAERERGAEERTRREHQEWLQGWEQYALD
jgi:hypothetical protein